MRTALASLLVALCAASPGLASDRPTSGVEFLHSHGTGNALKAATTDSFPLYGGPGSSEGKFENEFSEPDWQGWTRLDESYAPSWWQRSSFMADNLHDHGPDNHAMWCGRSAEQEPGWASAPGYGNNWNTFLEWRSPPLADPSVGQTVDLSFVFNLELEPGEDYLYVQFERGGSWLQPFQMSHTNKEFDSGIFPSPGLRYPEDVAAADIAYVGNDYGGENHDQIVLRLLVKTDGAWSDVDGWWDTDGAAQVDDLLVQWTDEGPQSSFEDFEGEGPYAWVPTPYPYAGDFSKLLYGLSDNDPCRENGSWQATFVDDGTPPRGESASTGGSLSALWDYGLPGGWVVNHEGGISGGAEPLSNEIWSPPIAWDLPGPEDDGIEGAALLRFDLFEHLPLENGIFWNWGVRSSTDGGATWERWRSWQTVRYGPEPRYRREEWEIGPLLEPGLTHLQIMLGVRDLAEFFQLPGTDATPSPWYDNVSVVKVRPSGPSITTREIDLFQDSFPNSGSLDYAGDPLALSCRLDMARDIRDDGALHNVHGDSMLVDVTPTIPGTTVRSISMNWILDLNPAFDAVRSMPPGAVLSAGTGPDGWDQGSGVIQAQPSTTPEGIVVEGRWFFDFPYEGPARAPYQDDGPEAMFFPGDVLRYSIAAEDDAGNVSTLPIARTGFADGDGYDRRFTVRALPSLLPDGGGGVVQPSILVVNDVGHGPHEPAMLWSLRHNHLVEHAVEGFDVYTVNGASAGVGNGIGAVGACGASPEQLAGYRTLLYLAEDEVEMLLSDGSRGEFHDKSDDLSTLRGWSALEGPRGIAYFGSDIGHASWEAGAATRAYLAQQMGVVFVADDVAPAIGDRTSPVVLPMGAAFSEPFVANGRCPTPRDLDHLEPAVGAVMAHGFEDPSTPGKVLPSVAASVLFDRLVEGDRKIDLTFPFAFGAVEGLSGWAGEGRVELIGEILESFGHTLPTQPPATGDEPAGRPGIHALRAVPNPFNPSTVLCFSVGRDAGYRVELFDLRGRLVRRIHDGPLQAGPQRLPWDGRDGHGREVASGVYLVKVEGDGQSGNAKVVLIR